MAFDTTVFLPLDTQAVFELVTEPERLRRWKTVAARIELHIGGEYRWTITPGNTAKGHLIDLVPGKKMVLSWGWEGSSDLPPGASTVTITLEGVQGGTNLRLVHDGLTEEQSIGHAQGWNHYLERLSEYATTGVISADPWTYAPENLDVVTSVEAALVIAQRVLHNISDSDFNKATPCSEMNVGQLIGHLHMAVANFAKGLEVTYQPNTSSSPEVMIADAAQAAIEGFRLPRNDRIIDITYAKVPMKVAAGLMSMELLVHGWDLAAATGQNYDVSPEVANFIFGNVRKIITQETRNSGLFGPELIPNSDASPIEKLIAFTGRPIRPVTI